LIGIGVVVLYAKSIMVDFNIKKDEKWSQNLLKENRKSLKIKH